MHAQPHAARAGRLGQRPRRARRRDGGRQIVFEESGQVAHAQGAEHQDGRRYPRRAQLDSLLDVGAGEQRYRRRRRAAFRRRPFEGQGDRRGAMAVGVGLDDGDYMGRSGTSRRAAARDMAQDRAVVVDEGIEIDGGVGRANHRTRTVTRRPAADPRGSRHPTPSRRRPAVAHGRPVRSPESPPAARASRTGSVPSGRRASPCRSGRSAACR